jgi:hypothetical protein
VKKFTLKEMKRRGKMVNLTGNRVSEIPPIYFGTDGARPLIFDKGPVIEFTEVRNDESLSIICLSNGIELETNHDDNFIMNDTVSGYYFTSLQNGTYVFGKGGKKVAVLSLLHSNEAKQKVISIKNSAGKERVYSIAFLEIKRIPNPDEEYILVQARAEDDEDSQILSKTDSYLLQKFSFSMRQIVERYPEGISPASERISENCPLALAGAVLSLVGICMATKGPGLHYFAVDVNLLVSFFTLSQKTSILEE